jgi:hypothetical protein
MKLTVQLIDSPMFVVKGFTVPGYTAPGRQPASV